MNRDFTMWFVQFSFELKGLEHSLLNFKITKFDKVFLCETSIFPLFYGGFHREIAIEKLIRIPPSDGMDYSR